jgi:hypothetical protein
VGTLLSLRRLLAHAPLAGVYYPLQERPARVTSEQSFWRLMEKFRQDAIQYTTPPRTCATQNSRKRAHTANNGVRSRQKFNQAMLDNDAARDMHSVATLTPKCEKTRIKTARLGPKATRSPNSCSSLCHAFAVMVYDTSMYALSLDTV